MALKIVGHLVGDHPSETLVVTIMEHRERIRWAGVILE